MGVNLSQDSFVKNEATFLLSLMAFNYLEILRCEMECATNPRDNPPSKPDHDGFDMKRFRNIVLKVGGIFSRASRRLYLDIADGIAPLWMALLARLKKLHPVPQSRLPVGGDFTPLPNHAYRNFTPRM